MTRIRCQGCLAKDRSIDLLESAEYLGMEGWHYCLNCGNVLDSVVEREASGPTVNGLDTSKW